MHVGSLQVSDKYRSLSRLVCSMKRTNHPETEHQAGCESLTSVPHIWPSPPNSDCRFLGQRFSGSCRKGRLLSIIAGIVLRNWSISKA